MAHSTRHTKRRNYSGAYARPRIYWDATATLSTKSGEYEYTPCVYCGEPFDDEEHVFPINELSSLEMLEDDERDMLIIVPACRECNGIAGAIRDHSFEDRRDRVKSILRNRYRQYVERPDWDDEEMTDFGEAVGGHIARGNFEQDRIQARLAY